MFSTNFLNAIRTNDSSISVSIVLNYFHRSNERQRSDFARSDRSTEHHARIERSHDKSARDDGRRRDRSDERPMRGEPNRRDNDRERRRSPEHQRSNEHQASRPNPFRRNQGEERPDSRPNEVDGNDRNERRDRGKPIERVERNDRNDRIDRNDRNDRRNDQHDRIDHKDRNDRNERNDRNNQNNRPSRFDRRRPVKEEDNEDYEWGKPGDKEHKDPDEPVAEKEKPNFGLSGKLTEDANKVNGTVLKYTEPPEARRPKRRWRLYPFKGEESLQTLHIHRQSCFLIGREKKICDIPVDHPSCSKQHAVLQFRLVPFERADGTTGKRVRPYIIDLESSNGTYLNNNQIEPKKYVELMERDLLKFGYSTREYVLLHEDSHISDEVGEHDIEHNIKSEK